MCLKDIPDHGLYVPGIATLDLERKRAETALPEPWQTDTSIGPWGYDVRRPYRPTVEIVHELVDIVSKRGCMLLNVGPAADGSIPPAAQELLLRAVEFLKDNPQFVVEIQGHTDSTGSDEVNEHLSQQRAEAVRQYLVANRTLSYDRIVALGYGSMRPLASNQTAEGRAINRRIDVIVRP